MIRVNIPSFRRVNDDRDSYTVFCVTVRAYGHQHVVERRYTDFEELHKKLKQKMATGQFPAKAMLKWSPKVLEHRRQVFEKYLQSLIEAENIPKCVLRFLEVKEQTKVSSSESLDQLESYHSTITQPTIAFLEDAFLHEPARGGLTDIITIGTLQGLYGSRSSIDDEA